MENNEIKLASDKQIDKEKVKFEVLPKKPKNYYWIIIHLIFISLLSLGYFIFRSKINLQKNNNVEKTNLSLEKDVTVSLNQTRNNLISSDNEVITSLKFKNSENFVYTEKTATFRGWTFIEYIPLNEEFDKDIIFLIQKYNISDPTPFGAPLIINTTDSEWIGIQVMDPNLDSLKGATNYKDFSSETLLKNNPTETSTYFKNKYGFLMKKTLNNMQNVKCLKIEFTNDEYKNLHYKEGRYYFLKTCNINKFSLMEEFANSFDFINIKE